MHVEKCTRTGNILEFENTAVNENNNKNERIENARSFFDPFLPTSCTLNVGISRPLRDIFHTIGGLFRIRKPQKSSTRTLIAEQSVDLE